MRQAPAMRIALVYNAVADENRPDESDVLIQADAVEQALKQLGHRVVALACSLNLAAVQNRLAKIRPDIVFNLVESLNGRDRLVHLLPAMLDSIGMPYTGSRSEALHFTSNKILAKQWMVQADLPTAPWLGPCPPDGPFLNKHHEAAQAAYGAQSGIRWLIKSLWQHASSGLREDELIHGENADRIRARLSKCAAQLGGACFAEAFIDGREFNLALLAQPREPQVLPPAEIIFEDYPENKLRIVGYRAKWEKDSYEYQHTPRRFDFPPQDAALLMQLAQMAKKCWQVFGLGGYARVDFRVDGDGQPWILEINTNPCLSPDAGFAAAVQQAGLTFAEAVERILSDAITGNANPC
jgi:D-alanine-D-alanine ligase